jgi:GNAT superfamily N-acetyltransferase
MRVKVNEVPISALEEYADVPIAFEVSSVLDVAERGDRHGEFVLTERNLAAPYVKDYDSIEGEHPTRWAKRFDVSKWGLFTACVEGQRVGGTVVAYDTPELDMLEDRGDLAVLWDIRVSPGARGNGVGSELFRTAEAWARARGCRQLKVETQNINVAACRFYARQECVLAAVHRFAYPKLPNEIQMLWYKDLHRGPNSDSV